MKLVNFLKRNAIELLMSLSIILLLCICVLLTQSIELTSLIIEKSEKTIQIVDQTIEVVADMNHHSDSINKISESILNQYKATSDFDYSLLSEEDRERLEMMLKANCAPSRTASMSNDKMPQTGKFRDMPDILKDDLPVDLKSGRSLSESDFVKKKVLTHNKVRADVDYPIISQDQDENPKNVIVKNRQTLDDFPDIESDSPLNDFPDYQDRTHKTIYYRVQNPDGTWDLDSRYDGGPSNGEEIWIDIPYPGLEDGPEDNGD